MLVSAQKSYSALRWEMGGACRSHDCPNAMPGTTLAAMLAGIPDAAAHEIPADVKLNAFVKPAGNRLELLIRVPMAALVEVEFPLRGPGYLEMSRVDEALRSAAKLYLTDNITSTKTMCRCRRRGSWRCAYRCRPTSRSRRSKRARACAGAAARGQSRSRLEPAVPRRAARISDPVGRSEFALAMARRPVRPHCLDGAAIPAPGGETRAFEFHGDPGLLRLDPRWHQAALRFVVSGFWHILEGIDHLLFLFCLVIPFRRLRPLVIIVTSFTVAHSISLIAAAFGFAPDALWFPPLIETLIAVTIVYMALENIVCAGMGKNVRGEISRRWIIAFAFGIIHGFGFSFALRESLQFAGDHLVTSLLAFNVGVEIGQIAVLVVLIPALGLLFRYVMPERLGIIILSALVAHTGWHWMLERGEQFAKFPFPKIDAAFLASAMRGLMAMLILAGGVLLVNGVLKRWIEAGDVSPARGDAEQPPRGQN